MNNITLENMDRTINNTITHKPIELRILNELNEQFENAEFNFNYEYDTHLNTTFLQGLVLAYQSIVKPEEDLKDLYILLDKLYYKLVGQSSNGYRFKPVDLYSCYKLYQSHTELIPQWRYTGLGKIEQEFIKDYEEGTRNK